MVNQSHSNFLPESWKWWEYTPSNQQQKPLKIGRAPKENFIVFQPSVSRCYCWWKNILHQLIWYISHYLHGFLHPRWDKQCIKPCRSWDILPIRKVLMISRETKWIKGSIFPTKLRPLGSTETSREPATSCGQQDGKSSYFLENCISFKDHWTLKTGYFEDQNTPASYRFKPFHWRVQDP